LERMTESPFGERKNTALVPAEIGGGKKAIGKSERQDKA